MTGNRMITAFISLVALFTIIGSVSIERPAYAAGVVSICNEANLRDAINGGGTVTFTCSGTIELEDMIIISANTTIDGTGQNVSISGNYKTRLFQVEISTTLTLTNLTLTKGYGDSPGDEAVPHDGGTILNYGTLNITGCTFSNNSVPLVNEGGAIYSKFPFAVNVSISNSTFSGNSAGLGGAIKIACGTLNISKSTFLENTAADYAAALDLVGGNVTIDKTSFLNNISQHEGAINHDSGTLTITNSTFAGNQANNGIGGAIFSSKTVILANSTFSGNSSTDGGGAIYFDSNTVTITNCTFAGNSASFGGAIYYYKSLTSTLTLKNTIVADSPSGGNCWGTIADGGNNIQFGGTVANSCGATIPTPVSDPLGSNVLANNVGPTQTIALPAGSAAIDQGNDAVCAAAPVYGVDQRGVTRPQGPLCDIGAYELIQHPPTENCYYYEYTYTSLDNPEDSDPSCTELCFNYGDNSGTFAGLCNSFGNLVLFFDSMKKQALWYSTSTPSLGFLKFHGSRLHVFNGITYCVNGMESRFEVRGHQVDSCFGM